MKNALINIADALASIGVKPRFGEGYRFTDTYSSTKETGGYCSVCLKVSS